MVKRRPRREEVEITKLVGDVRGKRTIIVDDMISTGGTVIRASQRLVESGAKEVSVVATHGLFSGDAVERLEKSPIRSVYVSNTIKRGRESGKIRTVDISGFLEGVILSAGGGTSTGL